MSESASCAMVVGYGSHQLAVAPDPGGPYPVPPCVVVTAIDSGAGTCIAVKIDSAAARVIAHALLAACEKIAVAEANFKRENER